MIPRSSIEAIEKDVKIVNPKSKKEIEAALRVSKAWLRAPTVLTRVSFVDLELSLSVYGEWMKSSILKDSKAKEINTINSLYTTWQKSSLLKEKTYETIRRSVLYMEELSRVNALRNTSARQLAEADALAAAWERSSVLRSKTPKDLDEALGIVDAWKRSPLLSRKTPQQIEADMARVNHCKTADAAQKEKKEAEYAIVQEWRKSSIFSKLSTRDLENAAKMVDEHKRNSLLSKHTPQQIEDALVLVKGWKNNALLKKANVQELADAEIIVNEWKRVFPGKKVSDLSNVARVIDEWNKNSKLGSRTLLQIQKDLELGEEWNKIPELRNMKASVVEGILKFIEECGKMVSSSEYQKLVGAQEQKLKIGAVVMVDPVLLAGVDLNLTNPGTSDAWEKTDIYDGLERLQHPKPEFEKSFSVGTHLNNRNWNHQFITSVEGDLTAFDLADKIRESPKYRPGQDIVLYICAAGYAYFGRTSFAQILATELGATVHAADGFIKLYLETGEIELKEKAQRIPILPDTWLAEWKTFYPEDVRIRTLRRLRYDRMVKELMIYEPWLRDRIIR